MPVYEIPDEAAMIEYGRALSGELNLGDVVYLQGELGAGKTTLVRGILQGLGHDGIVTSPTYTLVEPYDIGGADVFHFDLYRLESADELENIGAREMLTGGAICLVEWPEKGATALPVPDLEIRIDYLDSGRQVSKERNSE